MFVYVCVCVCTCVYVHVYAPVCAQRPKDGVGCPLSLLGVLYLSFSADFLSLNPGSSQLSLKAASPSHPYVSAPSQLRLQCLQGLPTCFVGAITFSPHSADPFALLNLPIHPPSPPPMAALISGGRLLFVFCFLFLRSLTV